MNFFLDRARVAAGLLGEPAASPPREGKVIVEHTNINPNKAAHIGHLRNALLGDVLVRALRFLGHEVEVQNYLDDTGVQVADVVAGFLHIAGVGSEREIREVIATATLPGGTPNPKGFAYLCWDLYAEVGRTYKARPETERWRTEVLHAIEEGENETAAIAAAVAEAISSAHLATMGRIGIAYDLLPRESDILRRNFWALAFDRLKTAGPAALETEGNHAGCWVLRLSESEEFAGLEEPDKILVRSNGTVTYTAKDIAYQLWKFGLLGADFDYERFEPRWDSGAVAGEEIPEAVRRHPVWRTSHGAGQPGRPAVRAGRARDQRHRREAVLHPESGQGGAARSRLREGSGGEPLPLRDRGAFPEGRAAARGAVRRGIPALRRRREEAVRRDVGPQGARRQGRRPRRDRSREVTGGGPEAPGRGRPRPPRRSRTRDRSPSGLFAISS